MLEVGGPHGACRVKGGYKTPILLVKHHLSTHQLLGNRKWGAEPCVGLCNTPPPPPAYPAQELRSVLGVQRFVLETRGSPYSWDCGWNGGGCAPTLCPKPQPRSQSVRNLLSFGGGGCWHVARYPDLPHPDHLARVGSAMLVPMSWPADGSQCAPVLPGCM